VLVVHWAGPEEVPPFECLQVKWTDRCACSGKAQHELHLFSHKKTFLSTGSGAQQAYALNGHRPIVRLVLRRHVEWRNNHLSGMRTSR
jgi:hypothetical protein